MYDVKYLVKYKKQLIRTVTVCPMTVTLAHQLLSVSVNLYEFAFLSINMYN